MEPEKTRDPLRILQTLTLSVLLMVLVGHILVTGRTILLPMVIAVITVYIHVTATDWLSRQPGGRLLPDWLRQIVVLAAFIAVIVVMGSIVTAMAGQVQERLPDYLANLTDLLDRAFGRFGFDDKPDLTGMWSSVQSSFSLEGMALNALGSFASLGGMIVVVILYASFLLAERKYFAVKLAVALPGEGSDRAARLIDGINRKIGRYLATKTLINVLLGTISFLVMLLVGLDFALFWAVVIALLNYIPYVGSYVGVFFPAMLSLAQFGTLPTPILMTSMLIGAQLGVGNYLDPKLVGREVNMSPFVVLAALAVWFALWGIPGAILAVPLTSVVLIVLEGFDSTRPIAILLSNNVDAFQKEQAA
ncbi:MAG: AI-2E family transporter [Rubellimicrobium sp.]|nr:AI-2E family transporter [Rubellimicrobium sp.]